MRPKRISFYFSSYKALFFFLPPVAFGLLLNYLIVGLNIFEIVTNILFVLVLCLTSETYISEEKIIAINPFKKNIIQRKEVESKVQVYNLYLVVILKIDKKNIFFIPSVRSYFFDMVRGSASKKIMNDLNNFGW